MTSAGSTRPLWCRVPSGIGDHVTRLDGLQLTSVRGRQIAEEMAKEDECAPRELAIRATPRRMTTNSPSTRDRHFLGARLKVRQARGHVDVLYRLRDHYLSTLNISMSATGLLTYRQSSTLDWAFAPTLGDSIHDLRSALDHLAYELVRLGGRNPSEHLYFPFAKTRAAVLASRSAAELTDAVGEETVTKLLDAAQPYPGGHHALYELHELDKVDKHRMIVPLAAYIEAGESELYLHKPSRFQSSGTLIGSDVPTNVDIVFGIDGPFAGLPVVPVVDELFSAVSTVLDVATGLAPEPPIELLPLLAIDDLPSRAAGDLEYDAGPERQTSGDVKDVTPSSNAAGPSA